MREKVGKPRNTAFFQWFVAPEGRKKGSLKRRVRSQLARWEMKNCTPLWREAHFQVKMYKTPASDDFWKLRCRKSARRCGAKHISKSKCTKHTILGPLLEVQISKKWKPLWREAHFEVKMYKTPHVLFAPLLEVQMSKNLHPVVARSTFRSQNVQNTTCSVRATFGGSDVKNLHPVVARSTFRSQNVKNTRGFGPLLEVQMSLRFASLQYITLHSTTLHCTTLHYIIQRYNYNYTTTLHYTPLH